jgi:hypothetical protein
VPVRSPAFITLRLSVESLMCSALMPTGSRPLSRSGCNVTYCTIGVRRSVTEMQTPARVGPFFAIATHPDLGRCCGLRRSLDRFLLSL